MKMSNCQRRRLCSSHARSYPSSLLKKHVQSTETAGNKTNMYTNPCMLYHRLYGVYNIIGPTHWTQMEILALCSVSFTATAMLRCWVPVGRSHPVVPLRPWSSWGWGRHPWNSHDARAWEWCLGPWWPRHHPHSLQWTHSHRPSPLSSHEVQPWWWCGQGWVPKSSSLHASHCGWRVLHGVPSSNLTW